MVRDFNPNAARFSEGAYLRDRVLAVPHAPQTQASLRAQQEALWIAANRLGLYDAADWLKETALR